jgi:hypothetical protein
MFEEVIKMITQEKTIKGVTRLQRRIMRKYPSYLLQEVYEKSTIGWSEEKIGAILGVNMELFKGALHQVIAEALWERGYFVQEEK